MTRTWKHLRIRNRGIVSVKPINTCPAEQDKNIYSVHRIYIKNKKKEKILSFAGVSSYEAGFPHKFKNTILDFYMLNNVISLLFNT